MKSERPPIIDYEPDAPARRLKWWQFGLVGAVALSVATAVKVIRSLVRGTMGESGFSEALLFAAAIFAMGFICGVVVWVGRGWHRHIGMAGDALLGMVVMVVFFLSCMAVFDPEMLGAKFTSGGVPMLVLGSIIGLVVGASAGRDLRKKGDDH